MKQLYCINGRLCYVHHDNLMHNLFWISINFINKIFFLIYIYLANSDVHNYSRQNLTSRQCGSKCNTVSYIKIVKLFILLPHNVQHLLFMTTETNWDTAETSFGVLFSSSSAYCVYCIPVFDQIFLITTENSYMYYTLLSHRGCEQAPKLIQCSKNAH